MIMDSKWAQYLQVSTQYLASIYKGNTKETIKDKYLQNIYAVSTKYLRTKYPVFRSTLCSVSGGVSLASPLPCRYSIPISADG